MQQHQGGLQAPQNDPSRSSERVQQDPWDLPLGAADQACKECRRRKAKCNRGIPTCGLCLKYNRHCLYEKHSKTPLTRKHLTEVEERLERAEALLRKARLIPPVKNAQRPLPNHGHGGPADTFDFSGLGGQAPSHSSTLFQQENIIDGYNAAFDPFAGHVDVDTPTEEALNHKAHHLLTIGNSDPPNPLEPPPMDDFEWDEQHIGVAEPRDSSSAPNSPVDEESMIDGMASLTVDEKQGGYLGVASGAALLRIMSPFLASHQQGLRGTESQGFIQSPTPSTACQTLLEQPDPNRHIIDSMIDSYFRLFHLSYPIIHEPTFRAEFSEVIPRPNGNCWKALAYMVAAIGVWTTSNSLKNTDIPLFAQAKSYLSIDLLESGNLTLVQALALGSNYLQKRNKPNSGYNYLGLAIRMAMSLGLHKEFQGWNISPLKMEIRRRVWWLLCCFDVGGTITFSRPLTWPGEGVEVSLPLNIHDRDLTTVSAELPPPIEAITPYSAMRLQSSFHNATNSIYRRVISKPLPTSTSLLELDSSLIDTWLATVPPYFSDLHSVPPNYRLAHAITMWRYPNFRIIMYRPFVIRRALHRIQGLEHTSEDDDKAYDKCLKEAKSAIAGIAEFWQNSEHTRMAAWYALYFLFQASLIPCICLRNDPRSSLATSWREQITSTLSTIQAFAPFNSSAPRCYQVIQGLCGQFLNIYEDRSVVEIAALALEQEPDQVATPGFHPTEESPQTQLNNVYSMMWPNLPALEADVVMQDDAWMEFLMGENDSYGLT